MSAIRILQLEKIFKGHHALKGIDLEVKDKEFCVLLGPSGCGKTTLLRIIAGLETASSGDVLIGDKRVNDLPPRSRNIAMVFQNYAVFPHMTIGDNIAFGLKMQGKDHNTVTQQVKRAAGLMHIEHLLERYAGQLSGGQRQRVAVARALAVQPDVLLMDEPLSNLDALLRLEMRSELKALLTDIGCTTLYVTHDQTEAMSLADRIAVMHGGVIEQYSHPADIYHTPATTFVGGFIGNPPMNFILSPLAWEQLGVTPPQGAHCLGIRPEDLLISPRGLSIKPLVVEMLGASQQITSKLDDMPLRISVDNTVQINTRETLCLQARPDKARWYDPDKRLLNRG